MIKLSNNQELASGFVNMFIEIKRIYPEKYFVFWMCETIIPAAVLGTVFPPNPFNDVLSLEIEYRHSATPCMSAYSCQTIILKHYIQ